MKNILLICSAGMSTSILVNKMKIVADERGLDLNIWAIGDAEKAENIPKADVVLLGPQIRFMLKSIQDMVENKKPVQVIDMASYGAMNGKKVLDVALELLG